MFQQARVPLSLCFNIDAVCDDIPEGPLLNPSWIDAIDVDALPLECFLDIEDRCMDGESFKVFTCRDTSVSRAIVDNSLLSDGLILSLEFNNGHNFDSVSIYSSECDNGSEVSWTGNVTLSGELRLMEVLQTPSFTSVSFLSFESFSTSSVQFACIFVNGDEVAFSAIVGGIVIGREVSESQYSCAQFAVERITVTLNSTAENNGTTVEYDYAPEFNGQLTAEYVIVLAYILISYVAAGFALRRRYLQKTMSDFKVFLNSSFAALFLVWGTGNLVYTVCFSLLLDESNFFFIKLVLTVTYFMTYYGFALIVHYRYRC